MFSINKKAIISLSFLCASMHALLIDLYYPHHAQNHNTTTLASNFQVPNPIKQLIMSTDWGPVIVAVILFILLSPGLLFQVPARTRVIEFGNMYTSGISILVHSIFFFVILTILVLAIGVHVRT
jgi:Protein of unknown function (DUF3339)